MAEEQKKRRGRRAYLDDYETQADGQIVYTGKVYIYTGARSWKKALGVLWLWTGLLGVCVLICGMLPASGMLNTVYVLLPWVLAFVGMGSVILALYRMARQGKELKEHVYKSTAAALPLRVMFTAVCCAVTSLGQGIKLILDGLGNSPAADLCFIPLMALAAVLATVLWPQVRKLPFAPRP